VTNTIVSQAAVMSVTIDGSPLSAARLLSVEWEEGFDLPVARATITYMDVPTGHEFGNLVTITAGATNGTSALRFSGRIAEDFDYQPDEPSTIVSVPCVGHLHRAERYKTPTNTNTPEVPGMDMVNGGAGATDRAQVMAVLDACGLSSHYSAANIGGWSNLLGTQTGTATKGVRQHFVWKVGETGLSYIQKLDAIGLGYRTFDSGGSIVRRRIIARPHPTTSAATFTEGVDIFKGGRGRHSIRETANRVTAAGFNYGDGPVQWTATGVHPKAATTGVSYVDWEPPQNPNPMIEKVQPSDPGTGRSAREVAEWHLMDRNHVRLEPTFTTYRDDVLGAGDTISVEWPAVEMGQTFWVRHLRDRVDDEGWTRELQCTAPAQVGAGGAALPLELFYGAYIGAGHN
jgi:hypothetical protein